MAKTPTGRDALPRRFRPLFDQATTETAIRYGGQEDALGSILSSLAHDYGQQAAAQHTAGMSVLGALEGADKNLQQVYAESGITPSLLASPAIANSPTGQRLAGELASGRAGIQNQILGQQQGQQYLQGHIGDMYQQDRSKVTDQITSLEKEKGLYGSSLLDSLISGDRATRHSANVAFRAQQHADAQARADRNATQENALIGQGLLPGKDGALQPLPGGKADPNAPANQPKPAKPKKPAKPSGADRTIQDDFRKAAAWIKQYDHPNLIPDPVKRRAAIQEILLKGDPNGTGAPSIASAGLDAALDMYFNKALSPETVAAIHSANAKVKFLNGAKTQRQLDRENNYDYRVAHNQAAGPPSPKS